MSRWFRFYPEAMRSPRVLRLSDKDFRSWMMLLSIAAERDGKIPADDVLTSLMGMRSDHLSALLSRLLEGGLMDPLEDGYAPHGWDKYQYKSDSSTARVKKHRDKRNVSETPPDTETDTEKVPPSPRKRGSNGKHLIPEDWVVPAVSDLPPKAQSCAKQWSKASYETEAEAFHCYWRSERKMKADWGMTWANRIVQRHSAIMRDQKFGNAPTSITAARVEHPPQYYEEQATWFAKHGMEDDAERCRRKAKELRKAA